MSGTCGYENYLGNNRTELCGAPSVGLLILVNRAGKDVPAGERCSEHMQLALSDIRCTYRVETAPSAPAGEPS